MLGYKSRARMLADLSSSELADWQNYSAVEPIGPERADLQAAVIASTIANVHRDSKKRPKPFTFADFMPFSGTPESEQSADQDLSEQIKSIFSQFNNN